ncbi:hypothetical protein E5675_03940 [Sphingopyxis sp. PAMC25046]|nr:hypothetical protein E5675_03940 [Sphingopyxis sp. PAMC25046]
MQIGSPRKIRQRPPRVSKGRVRDGKRRRRVHHSLLKRGIIGAFHHVSDKHLPRYLAEFDRRWNTRSTTDGERAVRVIETAIGKRLTYSDTIA